MSIYIWYIWYYLYMLSYIRYICYIYHIYLYNLYIISYTYHIINIYIYIYIFSISCIYTFTYIYIYLYIYLISFSLCMWLYVALDKSGRSQMFLKLDVFKNFAMSTGKHLCWSLFLIKLQAWRKKENSKRKL